MQSLLSLTGKRWQMHDHAQGVGADLASLLAEKRGITSGGDCEAPLVFCDSARASERLMRAVAKQEKIGIFGDYDCDGITGTALLMRMLRRRGIDPAVRLPHRAHDGYGLKTSHIDEFAAAGISLLLAVDTGITAGTAVERANETGIDVMIFDHHALPEKLPDACAILHPSLAEIVPAFPPCAAGVVFDFLCAFENAAWQGMDEDRVLSMIGTVADVVSLRGRNRRLVQEGLRALEQLNIGPLAELASRIRTGSVPLTSQDIAFRIAPRINAAGRMADPTLALRAILEGGSALEELETLNRSRQDETLIAMKDVFVKLDALPALPPFLCASAATYSPGIIGLIAGKLTERFGRPSMAVCIRGDECTASLRSPPAYSIIDGLRRCSEHLGSFGGHRQAAGCTFPTASLTVLIQALENDVATHVPDEALVPSLAIDCALPLHSVSLPLIQSLAALEPFGHDNPEPLFLIESTTFSAARTVGAEGKHLQAMIGSCKAIGFGLGNFLAHVRAPLDIVCRLGIDVWNGRMQPQLMIVDMKVASLKPTSAGRMPAPALKRS
ncbi:DHH family phosphoesterase [Candidatus Uhrbacteria bacterium]|nr:DHH family phosphoesterase [Candidatus Uhrbacteria bacterium]